MRVLSWNLYHGRDFPPDSALFTLRSRLLRVTERDATHVQVNRPLRDEFAGWIAEREWDVALLQEAPPLWFHELARSARANGRRVLTSRNLIPPLQRFLANLNPDLIASWEGGSNQLLVRDPGRVLEHRTMTLATTPERRKMTWARVRLASGQTVCVVNLHASAGLPEQASIEFSVRASGEVLMVEVADTGQGFDHSGAPRPRIMAGIAEPSGWGLFLVDRLSDRGGAVQMDGETRVWFELRPGARALAG